MTGQTYEIQYVDPNHVRDDLIRVWCNNFPVHEQGPAKFDWTYRKAVEPSDGVFVLGVHEAVDRARIVGSAGLVGRSFFADEHPLRAALLADIAVDRPHRTLLPAMSLVRSARRTALDNFDFAYGYPNKAAAGVFLRCGYRKLGALTRYALVLHYEKYVRRFLNTPVLCQAASTALDIGQLGLRAPRSLRALRRYRLEWPKPLDARFDRLWEGARPFYSLLAKRDVAFLRWRFVEHPEHRVRIVALTTRNRAREIRAYAALDRNEDTVCIRDLFGYPDSIGPLLDRLIMRYTIQGIASLSMCYLGSDVIVDILRSRGFRPRESERDVVYDTGKSAGRYADIIADVQSWHLTDADKEW